MNSLQLSMKIVLVITSLISFAPIACSFAHLPCCFYRPHASPTAHHSPNHCPPRALEDHTGGVGPTLQVEVLLAHVWVDGEGEERGEGAMRGRQGKEMKTKKMKIKN